MNRNQARFVIGLVLIVVLGGLGYRLGANLWQQQQSEQKLLALARDLKAEDADQRMQDFRRIKMRDGKKVWEIAATQAGFFEDRREVVVESPNVSLYIDNGDVIALRCREGRVLLGEDSQEVVRMVLRGDLEIQIGEYFLKTQQAIYDSAQNTISAPDAVQIVGRGLTVEGRGYQVAVDEKRMTLHAEVHTQVHAKVQTKAHTESQSQVAQKES
jgi:LPS export ABC transporter protein LptC